MSSLLQIIEKIVLVPFFILELGDSLQSRGVSALTRASKLRALLVLRKLFLLARSPLPEFVLGRGRNSFL